MAEIEDTPERSAHHEKAFFALLRLSAGGSPAEEVVLDDRGWQAVFRLAMQQALLAVVLDGVERLPAGQKPPRSLLIPWIGYVQHIEQCNRRLNSTVAGVCRRLEQDGVRCVVLKGQGNAVLYPRPLHRMAGDLDLWVEGGREAVLKYVRRHCRPAEVVYHHVDFPVLKDTEIELHFTPSWMNNWLLNRRLQRYFRQSLPRQLANRVDLPEDAGRIPVPTPDFNHVYLLLHIYRHLFDEGVGLRQLLDYYYLLRRSCSAEEKENALRMLRRLHLTRFASAVMYVLQQVFGLGDDCLLVPPSRSCGARLLDEIMLAGNFGQYDRRIVRRQHETARQRFCRKVLRNFSFLWDYPGEVLCSPLFKAWHYLWRLRHGYLPRK